MKSSLRFERLRAYNCALALAKVGCPREHVEAMLRSFIESESITERDMKWICEQLDDERSAYVEPVRVVEPKP